MAEGQEKKSGTLRTRVVAALVLVLAAWILLKLLVDFLGGVVESIIWTSVVVVLVGAIIWSLRKLR